jgi:hypothetical protein
MVDRHREITSQLAEVDAFAVRRKREIADRIQQLHYREVHRGVSIQDAIDAAERAAISLARALTAHERCALQQERSAAVHGGVADFLTRHGQADRAAYHRAAAELERARAMNNRREVARHRAAAWQPVIEPALTEPTQPPRGNASGP